MPDNPVNLRPWRALLRWSSNHPGLIVSAFTLTFAGFNILAFGNFDPEVAQTIVQEQGLAAVAVGQLLSIAATAAPLMLMVGLALPFLRRIEPLTTIHRSTAWPLAVIAAAATLTLERSTAIAVVTLPALVASAALISRRRARRRRRRNKKYAEEPAPPSEVDQVNSAIQTLVVLAVIIATVTIIDSDPWLPRERIDRTDAPSITGYVLNADGDELVVVRAQSKQVMRIARSNRTASALSRVAASWASLAVLA
ncbi:MAG: hypothetical protein EON92_16750, partial [Burkholderiales bacterium]